MTATDATADGGSAGRPPERPRDAEHEASPRPTPGGPAGLVHRRSPVRFAAEPEREESRGGWDVVLAYHGEGLGPWLLDLSHRSRWDFQDRGVSEQRPFGVEVPSAPGGVSVARGLMVNRMNRTQIAIWHLGPDPAPTIPTGPEARAFTDTTDSHCWLAVIGRETSAVLERVSDLDLFPPGREPPFLTQGPILHVACQVVTADVDCALIAVARGYGQAFTDALLASGAECGLAAAGEDRFTTWAAGRRWPR